MCQIIPFPRVKKPPTDPYHISDCLVMEQIVGWAEAINSLLETEYAYLVTIEEARMAYAILRADSVES